jgi:hypothetical protein
MNFGRERGRGGFVVIVVVGFFGDFDEGEVDGIARLCSKGVKVKVGEEFSLCAEGDGVGGGTTTAPKDSVAIVMKVKVVCSPVDERVDGGQPWFPENEVVVGEWVDECIQSVGVVVASDGKGGSG